jgi:hypothetical protein
VVDAVRPMGDVYEEDTGLSQNRSDVITPYEEDYRLYGVDKLPEHIPNQILHGMEPDPYFNEHPHRPTAGSLIFNQRKIDYLGEKLDAKAEQIRLLKKALELKNQMIYLKMAEE